MQDQEQTLSRALPSDISVSVDKLNRGQFFSLSHCGEGRAAQREGKNDVGKRERETTEPIGLGQ